MLEDFLDQNRELFVNAPSKLLRLLNDGFIVSNKESACIFYREGENEYDIVVGNKQVIIEESNEDDDYKGREYTTITIQDIESEKILTLLSMGLDFKGIIYMQYIKGKEDKEYSTTSCKDCDIIKESLGSENYAHRQYTIVNLSKDEEAKLLVLNDIGIDIKEAIVSFIKEEDIKWLNYKE